MSSHLLWKRKLFWTIAVMNPGISPKIKYLCIYPWTDYVQMLLWSFLSFTNQKSFHTWHRVTSWCAGWESLSRVFTKMKQISDVTQSLFDIASKTMRILNKKRERIRNPDVSLHRLSLKNSHQASKKRENTKWITLAQRKSKAAKRKSVEQRGVVCTKRYSGMEGKIQWDTVTAE